MATTRRALTGPADQASLRASTGTDRGLWACLSDYECTYMAFRNFAEATRRGDGSDLRLFIGYLDETVGIETVREVERTHLQAYFAELDRRGLAGATRARKLAAMRSFFSYLENLGLAPTGPAAGIPRPKQEVRQPRVLTEPEYQGLRASCKNHRRDRAIIELFLQTGLRLSEVAALRVCDLELPTNSEERCIGAVRVTGKGRKQRTVTLNWKACEALGAYLDGRCTADYSPVFPARTGARLTPRGIQRIVKKHMAEAAISGASVHTLRHTFATHMVKKGTNLRVVQEALGHTSLQTTSVYASLAREVMDQQLQANAL